MNTRQEPKYISFVIPCYQSTAVLREVVDELMQVCTENDYTYEIILVNDGSPDNTFALIEDICKTQPNTVGINLARNFGQHAAYMAGFTLSTGEIVICLDDDGQNPPSECTKLISAIENGFDAVFGSYQAKKQSIFRNAGSMVNEWMTRLLLQKPKNVYVSSHYAMRRFVVDEMIKYDNPYPYTLGLILRTTNSVTSVPIDHKERISGVSGYSIRRLIALWLNGFTAFSLKPLRVSTVLGLVSALAGIIYAIHIVINRAINPNVMLGWTSLMAAILFIGGLVLFTLGLLGEYVGRIYISLNKAPQFVIKEIINEEVINRQCNPATKRGGTK